MAPLVGLQPQYYDVTTTVGFPCSSCTDSVNSAETAIDAAVVAAASTAASGTFTTTAMPFMKIQDAVATGANASGLTGNDSLLIGSTTGSHDDATWILTSAFIVFTMQSGFGLLESGSVSAKNEVSIMVKNAVDVIFGGLSYWMFGFGLSFGEQSLSNPFCGWGDFFVADNAHDFGWVYSKFFFQASFATTATTIVSGAMAERTKLESYIIFSFVNTFVFCIPAHWVWAKDGWLASMGVIDIAGAGPVHLVGGVTGLVATLMLKPRHNRFKTSALPPMGSPSNAILGMFMLWWGWLGFNCGSTFGISGLKWKLAARSAVATICSSFAGGIVGLGISYFTKRKQFDVPCLINGVLSALVSVTGLCALAEPWEALVIGAIGAVLCIASIHFLDKMHVDDPVGCVGVHAVSGIWSMLAGGLFTPHDVINIKIINDNVYHYGLFKGGGGYLLGVQLLSCVAITAWTVVVSYILLKAIQICVGLRVSPEHELLGADLIEHGVGTGDCSYDKVTSTITWHKMHVRMGHTYDTCDLHRQVAAFHGRGVGEGFGSCTEGPAIADVGGRDERGSGNPKMLISPGGSGSKATSIQSNTSGRTEPMSLLRHVEKRRSKSLTYMDTLTLTERERIEVYGARASVRSSRTLGRRFGRKTFANMKISVGKRLKPMKKSSSATDSGSMVKMTLARQDNGSNSIGNNTGNILDNISDGFVLSNITIDDACN